MKLELVVLWLGKKLRCIIFSYHEKKLFLGALKISIEKNAFSTTIAYQLPRNVSLYSSKEITSGITAIMG
jgi:hypothetical protein